MRCRLFAMVLAAWTLPVCAQSLYKCPDPATGVVKYSQTPCTIHGEGDVLNVKPIPLTGGSTPPASLEETNRVQQLSRDATRKRRELEIDREIKTLENTVNGYRSDMNSELASLQYKKTFANNNLAGAAWEQSISSEMNAVSNKYDALIRNSQNRIEQLRKEADRLRDEEIAESQKPRSTP